MYSPFPRKEDRTKQNNWEQLWRNPHTLYISTTLREPDNCVGAVVNAEFGPLVGAEAFTLESLNLRKKVQSNPDIMRGDYRNNINMWKKFLFRRQRKST